MASYELKSTRLPCFFIYGSVKMTTLPDGKHENPRVVVSILIANAS